MQDHFKHKAQEWDQGDVRVNGAKVIADAILKKFSLTENMQIMDFGVGTGLLGFEIAKHVKQVYGVDMSQSMLEKLKEKNRPNLHIEAIHQDIVKKPLEMQFDGIISSMTLHHVQDIEKFFDSIYKNLHKNGFIAIADLEKEDGTFHSDNTGVYHYGFEEEELTHHLKNAGFQNISFEKINTISKPHKKFDIFLLTATR